MTPLHRVERRLLRECATWMLQARFIFRYSSDVGEAAHGFLLTNYLEAAASIAEEYRDLRDARRMMAASLKNPLNYGACIGCRRNLMYTGHAPGCALERIARDERAKEIHPISSS